MRTPSTSVLHVKGKWSQQPEVGLPTKSRRPRRRKARKRVQPGKGPKGTRAEQPQHHLRVPLPAASSASSLHSLLLLSLSVHSDATGSVPLKSPALPPHHSFPCDQALVFFMAQTTVCRDPVHLLVSLCLGSVTSGVTSTQHLCGVCCSPCLTIIQSSKQSGEVGAITTLVVHIRKLRLRGQTPWSQVHSWGEALIESQASQGSPEAVP